MKPHTNVYTRLRVSKYGIGVFAVIPIFKGTELFEGDPLPDMVQVNETYVETLPFAIQKLYKDFCPLNKGIYDCPKSFDAMGQSWYLNHSDTPNCYMDKNYEHLYAIRNIKAGEELTIDYHTFSEIPNGETV